MYFDNFESKSIFWSIDNKVFFIYSQRHRYNSQNLEFVLQLTDEDSNSFKNLVNLILSKNNINSNKENS